MALATNETIRVAWTACRLVLAEPFVIARASVAEVTTVFVRVAHGGLVGYGEARPAGYLGESAEQVGRQLGELAASGLLGTDPADLAGVHARLRDHGASGAVRAGLDAALHDLCGRRAGLPVYRLLGLGRGRVRSMRTVSLGPPARMARSAARLPRRATAKLKLGGRDGLDADRVRAVRAARAGPLAVDANGGWDLDEALALLPVLAACRVRLVEQPLAPGDPGAPAVKAAAAMPVVLDEECRDLADLERCADRAHGVNIKLGKCGGLLPAVELARAARGRGLRVLLGCHLESGLGIGAASQLSGLADWADLDGNLLLAADPWQGPVWRRGRQRPRRAPGLGVAPRRGYQPCWSTPAG